MGGVSGSFSGNVKVQTALAVSDQSNHELNVAEIDGAQKSTDEKWNNAKITYWGVTDIVKGKGSQHGYFVNDHGESGRDWGTFEGRVATNGAKITVACKYQFSGGSGEFKGLTRSGTFHTTMSSPTDVVGTWQGTYQLAFAKAHAR